MLLWEPLAGISSDIADEPDVTETGFMVGDLVDQAAKATDGSSKAVTTATNSILTTWVDRLTFEDLTYVAGVAGIANSSSVYWSGYAAGGGSPPDSTPPLAYSLFRIRWLPYWAARLAFHDVSGCLATAAIAWYTGTRKSGQLLGACGVGAIAASVLAAF